MSGSSTRFAFKILSRESNLDQTEVAANPVHLFYVIEQMRRKRAVPSRYGRTIP
ncbi:hypothetical protein P4S72_21130 [Vibrio sp. PP-XX7]